jgi:thioesterase domain-containing protein
MVTIEPVRIAWNWIVTRRPALFVALEPNPAASVAGPARRRPVLAGHPLYLVHPVGGPIDWYLPLARALAPYWDCYGLPHDTTGMGEARPPTVPELAAAYLDRIRAYQPAAAVTVAGWSFGAAVAYEIGRHAHGAGTPVAGLFLLDPPAPHADRPSADVLAEHLHTLWPTRTRQALADALYATADLLPQARATALPSVLGVPDGPVDRLLSLLVNHATLTGWEPAEPLPGVQLILPADATEPAASAAAWRARWPDERAITVVPGDHLTMLTTAGGVEQVAAAITATTTADVSSGDLSGAWASARVWG